MKIVKWITLEETNIFTPNAADMETDNAKPYYDELEKVISKNRYVIDGERHQHEYIPLFDNGVVIAESYRAWGHIMADIWNKIDNTDKWQYMNFHSKEWLRMDEKLPIKE